MKVISYSRVSSSQQDIDKQEHLLLKHARKLNLNIDEIIAVEISSTRSREKRRINELIDKLEKGDVLMVAELSRLGRDMLQTLNIINDLSEKGVEVIFIRQPELSTYGGNKQSKLLLAIYSYFAQAEREFIALRTKQGLEAAKAKGVVLGRPKGSGNKSGYRLDDHKVKILAYIKLDLKPRAILKLINPDMEEPVSLSSYERYIKQLKTNEKL